MSEDIPSHRFAPTWMGWLGALLSTGLVVGVLVLATMIARGYSIATLQESLAFTVKQPGGALIALESARYAPLFQYDPKHLRDWRSVIDLMTHRQTDKALKLISGKSFERHSASIRLQRLLERAQKLDAEEGGTEAARHSLITARNLAHEGFAELGKELDTRLRGMITGEYLPAQGVSGEDTNSAIDELGDKPVVQPIYTSGVLQGLPVVGDIPDGAISFKALAQFYPNLVKLDRTREAALTTTITALRERTSAALANCISAEEALTTFDRSVRERRLEREQIERQVGDELRDAVLGLGVPPLDHRVYSVYEHARSLLQQYGKRTLPPIRVA